jgi:polyisoprenoid-binding protein YceI
MRAGLAFVAILLIVAPLVIAQHGEEEQVPVKPEVTKFYIGQNLMGDLMMFEGKLRFDARAPMGMLGGFVKGMTGEAEIWLDSILVVETIPEDAPAPEEAQEAMAEPQDVPVDSVLEEEQEEALSEALPGAEEDEGERAEMEAVDTVPVVEAPAGYRMPKLTLNIPLSTLTTGSQTHDSILHSEAYLDLENYPQATFRLTNVESPSDYKLRDNTEISLTGAGELTLHGQTARIGNIRMFMTYISSKPLTEQNLDISGDILHINAELTFRLSEFGIVIPTEDLITVNDEIHVILDLIGTTQAGSM